MQIFDSLEIRGAKLPNRIVVSPMCEYSSTDGFANDWHLVHLGSRAVGGAGLVFTEATAVTADGRISPQDLGIWKDDHVEFLARITKFIRSQGAIPGIQLAHAGRKASTVAPWKGARAVPVSEGGWKPVAPTARPFAIAYAMPEELNLDGIRNVVRAFADAARRACDAGFGIVEIHSAHGYLLHEFLSPLSNERFDAYGGSFENRTRLLKEVITAVRYVWPEDRPLFVRLSATDWIDRGWDLDQSVQLAREIAPLGVDLIDCSSGGILPGAKIPVAPLYQVPFAESIRQETGVMTGAVGMITTPTEADQILREGKADLIIMAREFLRKPYWPLEAAHNLGYSVTWPVQYLRAAPDGTPAREAVRWDDLKRCMAEQHGVAES